MKFVTGAELSDYVLPRLAQSQRILACAPQISDREIQALKRNPSPLNISLICDLSAPDTDLESLESLRETRISVFSLDGLKTSFFLFDGEFAYGSLSPARPARDDEFPPLMPFGAIGKARSQYSFLESVFELNREQSRPFKKGDIAAARDVQSFRRRYDFDFKHHKPSIIPLLSYVINKSDVLDNRRVYVVLDDKELSSQGETARRNIKKELGNKRIDLYEDWRDMPSEATFVCFWKNKEGVISFNGYYKTLSLQPDNPDFKAVIKVDDIWGIHKAGSQKGWEQLITQWQAISPKAACVEIGKLWRLIDRGHSANDK